MANYWNHTRTRTRNFEFARLDSKSLKQYSKLNIGSSVNLSWSYSTTGEISLTARAIRTESGLHIFHNDSNAGYIINIMQSQLTYGKRNWWVCPKCGNRCSILYLNDYFKCRKCAGASYECQNGSRLDYLADKIREKRKKLWGSQHFYLDDLTENSEYLPKPKWMRWKTFNVERKKLLKFEKQYHNLWPAWALETL